MAEIRLFPAFSLLQQTAYGTALESTDITICHVQDDESMVEHTVEKFNNKEEVGKGHLWPTEHVNMQADSRLSRSFRTSSLIMAWAAAFALGDCTESQPDPINAPNTTKYVLKPMDISDSTIGQQLPVTTLCEKISDYYHFLYPDMLVKGFKWTGNLKEFLKLSLEMIGSGRKTEATMEMPSLASVSFLRFPDVTFTWGGTGVSAKVKSFEFSFDNTLDEDGGYTPQSGYLWPDIPGKKAQIRSQLLCSGQGFSLKFKVLLDSDDFLNDFEANQERSLELKAEGDLIETTFKHMIKVTIPKAVLNAAKVGKDGKFYVYDCEVDGHYDGTSGAPFTIEVITNVAGILAEPGA